VRYEPYQGVRLTPAGERVALEVIRHHRLLESFLAEAFDMPWDRVHDEAEVLEHYISEELEDLIATKLGEPERDPHGDPIPSPDLAIADEASVPLADIEPGSSCVFVRISDRDASMLRYLADSGIQPGARLRVREREPFGGPLLIEIDGKAHSLGGELVDRMRVRELMKGERS
jgi:DtxR family Mn-dependent transcriptional regulator